MRPPTFLTSCLLCLGPCTQDESACRPVQALRERMSMRGFRPEALGGPAGAARAAGLNLGDAARPGGLTRTVRRIFQQARQATPASWDLVSRECAGLFRQCTGVDECWKSHSMNAAKRTSVLR